MQKRVEGTDAGGQVPIMSRWQRWTAYLSHRLWVLCALLAVLSALALLQYRWIDQVAEAQRQRTQTNLSAALSNVESDFDIEVTRAFETFQLPLTQISYAERYQEWLHHAAYPNLIMGVYTTEARGSNALPQPVVRGEPPIRSVEWHGDLPGVRASFNGVAGMAAGPIGFQVFSTRGGTGGFLSASPEVTVDGNPAFTFPSMLPPPLVARRIFAAGKQSALRETEIVRSTGPIGPPRWVIVVLDANYMRSRFLPALVRHYFQNSSASDFDVVVVDRNRRSSTSLVVFPVQSAALPGEFAKPDGRARLFQLRLDCFSVSPSPPPVTAGAAVSVSSRPLDDLSQILSPKPAACSNPGPSVPQGTDESWELLAKYRAGSLDEAMTTFRRRNLFLSASVLLVLALGISMAFLLTERARALAEMQAEFVLGVSHELRTPLTVIRVAADNLKKGIVQSSEQARSYGEIMDTQAAELSHMVEETLMLARMRSEVIGHRTSVAPQQLLKDALADNESALRQAGMKVDFDADSELPDVSVDLRLIRRCVGNLIQNGIKYAAAGRELRVRARKVIRRDNQMVEISVEDHGPGISREDLPHIFEPFYRGRAADASQTAGIGLGLTLVKRAVEAHDGAVEVESAKSTRFSIFLPSQEDVQPDGIRQRER